MTFYDMGAAARLVAFTAALQLTPLTSLAPATLGCVHHRRHHCHHHHHPLLGLRSRRRESFPHPHNHLSSRSWNAKSEPEFEPDYLVTDSEGLTGRPSLWSAVANPRDGLALVLCGVGLGVSYANVVGVYDDTYVRLEVISCALGALSAVAAALQLLTGYNIRAGGKRRGIADDGRVTLFGGAYSLAVSWLALRASDACPPWLWDYDQQAGGLAIVVFLCSALAPAATLFGPDEWFATGAVTPVAPPPSPPGEANVASPMAPALSGTEQLRVRGLLVIGLIGAVFIPDCLAFVLGSQDWWGRVTAQHAAQTTLESTTSLCALYATEASMVSHRCGKAGVAKFSVIVPSFVVVVIVLTIAPCIAALHNLGDDISFFSFYSE